MEMFQMQDVNDKLCQNEFPKNIMHASQNEKDTYFDNILTKFLDTYFLQKDTLLDRTSEDYVENYGLCIIYLTILLLQLKDTAKEGDGGKKSHKPKIFAQSF